MIQPDLMINSGQGVGTMKVILTEYVYMHGVAGDVVDVADGFARNYLIPQGKAIKATPQALARHQALLEAATLRRKELTSKLIEVSENLNGTELVFGRKAGRNNKLYGSVTTMDIAKAILEETGIDIDRRRISERTLRELGEFDVPVRMGPDLSPVVKVVILPEEEVDNYIKRRDGLLDDDEDEEADEETTTTEDAELSAESEAVEEEKVMVADETMPGMTTEVLDTTPATDDDSN